MAIAASPIAPFFPQDESWGWRTVVPQLHPRPSPCAPIDCPGRLGPDHLVEIAKRLVPVAECWPISTMSRHRRWEIIAASDTFEAWVIVWPPGGSIELHDHGGSAGAVVVVDGQLLETSVAQAYSGELALRSTTLRPGSAISISDRHVHDIVNTGAHAAISIHIYSPRLSSMTYYRFSKSHLEARETVLYQLGREVP